MKRGLFFIFFVISSLQILAQPGANDPTFNPVDVGFNSGWGVLPAVWSSTIQSDGKIVIAGQFTVYNWQNSPNVIRLNTDGRPDSTFNVGTGTNGTVFKIIIQPDGKFILGGCFTLYNGIAANRIVRLNTDGSIDPSFNTTVGANDTINTMSLQTDGKIIIGGSFTSYDGVAANRIARINTDGTIDPSFSPTSGANGPVYAIAIQADGKFVIGGKFTQYDGTSRNCIARLTSSGLLDVTFNPGTGTTAPVRTIAIQVGGKIIIGGDFFEYNGTTVNFIVRVFANGTYDSGFSTGTAATNSVYDINIQPDSKIILAGGFWSFNGITRNGITRLFSNGSQDLSFNPGTGVNGGPWASGTSVQSDGKIIITSPAMGGYDGKPGRYRVLRINSNGSFDYSFNQKTGCDQFATDLVLQPDGKVILTGAFYVYNDSISRHITRIDTTGVEDPLFNSSNGPNGVVQTAAIQTDGKIIVGGQFSTINGLSRNNIGRLNSNGLLDTSFNVGLGFNDYVSALAIQNDGKIIAGGYFTNYNGNSCNKIVRLNTNGTIDLSFNIGTGFNSLINVIAIQPDGKILVGGSFNSYNGNAIWRLVRLNSDGSIDPTFANGIGLLGSVNNIIIRTDGKILIGGSITSYYGTPVNNILRLNPDGTIDPTFNVSTGPDLGVRRIVEMVSGQLIIMGDFLSYSGYDRKYLARVNDNGTLDTLFDPGASTNYIIHDVLIQPNQKFLIAGDFISYNNVGRNRIARIINCSTISIQPDTITGPLNVCNGTSQTYTVPFDSSVTNYTWILPTGWVGSSSSNSINVTAGDSSGSIIVIAHNTCGMSPAQSLFVTVNISPYVSGFATNAEICNGEFTTLTGSGASSYSWSGGVTDGISFNPSSTATYTVTGTDLNSCSNTSTITITVDNLPAVGANATNTSLCSGDPTTLTGTGASSYTWSGGVTDGIPFIPTSTNTYTVTGTDNNSCSNTNTITITVNSLPVVVANATDTNLCSGDPTILTGTGASSYSWSGGVTDGAPFIPTSTNTYTVTGTDVNSCSNTNTITITINNLPIVMANATDTSLCLGDPTILTGSGASSYTWTGGVTNGISFNPSVTDTYTVTGTDINSCTNTSTITVSVYNIPNVIANATDTNLCNGDPVILSGSGALSYSWSGGVIDGVSFNPTSTNTYTVIGTNVNSCVDTATISIIVNNLPNVNFNYPGNDTICISYGVQTLSGGTPLGGSYLGVGVSGTNFDPNIAGVGNHSITYQFTDVNGCSNSASTNIIVLGCLGLDQNDPLNLEVYPNPFDTYIRIICNGPTVNIKLYNTLGEAIFIQQSVSGNTNIYPGDLRAGIYYLCVETEQGIITRKLLKN